MRKHIFVGVWRCYAAQGDPPGRPYVFTALSFTTSIDMKLITWNLNKRRAIEPQIAALSIRAPDVIALQEVALNNLQRLRDEFAAVGYAYALDSVHAEPLPRRPFVMIVSRHPLYAMDVIDNPYRQGIVSAHVISSDYELVIHNVHVPSIGSHEMSVKFGFMDAVYRQLAMHESVPRIFCGDFNSPLAELADGTIITFGQTRRVDGSYAVVKGWELYETAERNLIEGLHAYDLRCAYRRLHGWDVQEPSWVAKNKGREFGFRLDHILSSEALVPVSCLYHHAWRIENLSDHAAMEAAFIVDL